MNRRLFYMIVPPVLAVLLIAAFWLFILWLVIGRG